MIEESASVPGDAAQLQVLTRFLQAFWATQGLPAAQVRTFELALEEVFMNVVMHGSKAAQSAPARVEVTLGLGSGGPHDDRQGRRA